MGNFAKATYTATDLWIFTSLHTRQEFTDSQKPLINPLFYQLEFWFYTLLIQKESTETKIKKFIYLTKNNSINIDQVSKSSAIFKKDSKPRLKMQYNNNKNEVSKAESTETKIKTSFV